MPKDAKVTTLKDIIANVMVKDAKVTTLKEIIADVMVKDAKDNPQGQPQRDNLPIWPILLMSLFRGIYVKTCQTWSFS